MTDRQMPEELRERIAQMKRELRRSHEGTFSNKAHRKREGESPRDDVVESPRPLGGTGGAIPPLHRLPSTPGKHSAVRHVLSPRATNASPRATTPCKAEACTSTPTAAACSGGPATPNVRTPARKQQLEPQTADEVAEMAFFVEKEAARRRADDSFSPAAKLRELRKEMGDAISDEAAPACSSRVEGPPRARRGGGKRTISRDGPGDRAHLSKSFAGKKSEPWTGTGEAVTGGSTSAAGAAKAAGPPHQKLRRHQTGGVEGLKDRQRREEHEHKEREHKKLAADRLLRQWMERTSGDVYEMMKSCKLFTDLFSVDPLANIELKHGDSTALKKAWHKLAAKLHPDRQRANSTATQVLAEEVFKALTLAYQKETTRLGVS